MNVLKASPSVLAVQGVDTAAARELSSAGVGNDAPGSIFRCSVDRRFIRVWGIALLAMAVLLPIVSFFWLNYFRSVDVGWIDCLYKQKTVIAARKTTPGQRKIVLVGGSGTLFSLDAELMEAKLKIPTVNFGIHAGLGVPYILDRASRVIKSGDVVVLCIEYGAWDDTRHKSGGLMVPYALTYDKSFLLRNGLKDTASAMWTVPLADYATSAEGWAADWMGKNYRLDRMWSYDVATLSRCGDINVNTTGLRKFAGTSLFPYPLEECVPAAKAFREFCEKAKKNNELVLYTWPTYADSGHAINSKQAKPPEWLSRLLTETGVQVLDSPMDNAYPASWFIDTDYHTNPVCRRVRTEELIRHMRPSLGLPATSDRPTGVYLLCGHDHFITSGNTFAHDENVTVRNLVAVPANNPAAITPMEVAGLIEKQVPVMTDSPAAEPLLATAKLSTEQMSAGKISFAEWVKQYPSSLILLSGGAGHSVPPGCESVLNASAAGAMKSHQAFAIIEGTGVYSGTLVVQRGEDHALIDGKLASFLPEATTVPAVMAIEGSPRSRVSVDFNDFVRSEGDVCAVALDPVLATVLDRRVFTAAPEIETWHMNRVMATNR